MYDLNLILKLPCVVIINDGTPNGRLMVKDQTFRLVDIINRIDDEGSYKYIPGTNDIEPQFPNTSVIRCQYGTQIESYRIDLPFEELEQEIALKLKLNSMNL